MFQSLRLKMTEKPSFQGQRVSEDLQADYPIVLQHIKDMQVYPVNLQKVRK